MREFDESRAQELAGEKVCARRGDEAVRLLSSAEGRRSPAPARGKRSRKARGCRRYRAPAGAEAAAAVRAP